MKHNNLFQEVLYFISQNTLTLKIVDIFKQHPLRASSSESSIWYTGQTRDYASIGVLDKKGKVYLNCQPKVKIHLSIDTVHKLCKKRGTLQNL